MNALHVLLISTIALGCGDGGPGAGGTFSPPTRGGSTVFAGSGSDRGDARDKGGGTTPAVGAPAAPDPTQPIQTTPPRTCTTHEQCSGGRCSRVGGGYCLQACSASGCGSGYQCVAGQGESFCLAPCSTAADCPRISGLSAFCALVEGAQYCFWNSGEQS